MANVCPNTSSQAWKDLVNRFGEDIAWALYVKSGDNIPTLRQALETVKSLRITYEPISTAEKMTLGVVDSKGRPVIYTNSQAQYQAAMNKAAQINANYGAYRARVVPSAHSPKGREYSEVYVERYVLPEDSKPDLKAYDVKPEEMYQISRESSKSPIKGLDGLLKDLAGKLGFQVNTWDKIVDKDGNPVPAIAQVDMVRRIITVALDKADATTLSEECAHIMVRMLGKDNPLYQRLMRVARDSSTFARVKEEYAEVYKGDEERMVEEAAGKLIAQEVVKLYETNSEQYVPESTGVVSAIKKLFNLIKSFFKRRAELGNITVESINLDMQPFTEVAQMMLRKQVTGLDNLEADIKNGDYYYELTQDMIATQLDAENYLKNLTVHYDVAQGAYLKADGTPVSRRVSDIVSRGVRRRFKVTSENESGDNDRKAELRTTKGTTVHAFLEALMSDRIEGRNSTKEAIVQKVVEKLRALPELASKSNNGIREIARVTDKQFNNLKEAVDNSYREILSRQAYIDTQTGTKGSVKIFTEQVVYDETRDLAGTCDLVAIYSNGVIDIYDYKTHEFTEEGGEIVSEISDMAKNSWNIQITQYKNIFTNGIRKQAEADGRHVNVNFGATRMLPINVQFEIDADTKELSLFGFRKIEPWSTEVHALNPVSLSEEVDLNPKLAKELEKLYQTRSAQHSKYLRTKSQLDRDAWQRTDDLIQNILVHQNYTYLFQEIEDISRSLQRRLTIPIGQPGSLTSNEILELKQRIDVYLDFLRGTNYLVDTSEDLNTRMGLGSAVKEALFIQDLLASKPVDLILAATGEDITEPGKHVGWWAGWFSKVSEIAHPIFKAFSKLLKSAQAQTHEDLMKVYDRVKVQTEALQEWAKANGKTIQDAFNMIVDTSTGNLINKTSSKFYQDLEKARASKTRSVTFFLDNYQVVRGPKNQGYRYTGKALEDFNKAKAEWLTRIENAKGTNQEAREERRYLAWRKTNDLAFNKFAMFNKYNMFIRSKYRVDNLTYYSEEFSKINDIKPLVDFYNMYVDFNIEFENITGRKISPRFIANVRNDLFDSIFKNGIGALTDMTAITLGALETRDESDVVYKSKDETSGMDYAGNPIKHVPLFFIDPLRDNLTSKDIARAEAAIDPSLTKDTEEWRAARYNQLRKIAEEKGLRHKSYDLSRVLLLMAQSVYTYKHMKEIEANAQLLLYHAKTNGAKVFVEDNIPNMDKWVGKVRTALGLSSDDVSILEKFIDLYVYGKSIQETGKPFTFMGKTYSWGKLAKKVVQWSSLSTLGFKPILGFRNYAQTMLNFKMIEMEGMYYTKESTKKSDELKKKDPAKYYGAISFFHIGNEDIWKKRAMELSANKTNRIFNVENAFYLLEATDSNIDRKVLTSMLYSWGYDEDKKKLVRLARSPKATPVADLLHVDENGKMTIDKLSNEDIIKFRTAAQSAATSVKGVMPAEDRYLANTTVAGTLIMQYRNWLPGLLRTRFKGLQKDAVVDEYDVGRFRVGMGEFAAGGQEITKAFGRMVLRSLPILGYLAGDNIGHNEAAARKQYDEYFRQHPNESKQEFTFEDFCQLRLTKLKALGFELQSIVGLFLMAMLAKALVPDDPEEDFTGWATSIATQNLYRSLYGAYLEASFFVDISSATDIISSPMAVMSYVTNLMGFFRNTIDETRDLVAGKDYKGLIWWEEDKKDKTKPFYFLSRLTPGFNAAQDFFNVYDTFTFNQR
jgi:hypothetical protein